MKKFIIILVISFFYSCKPDMPSRKNYTDDMLPCYLADVCLTVNAYMVNNKTDCTLALQKCYRYSDYDKCNKETDIDKIKQCWDELGVRE